VYDREVFASTAALAAVDLFYCQQLLMVFGGAVQWIRIWPIAQMLMRFSTSSVSGCRR
jgi:hypothetical protein